MKALIPLLLVLISSLPAYASDEANGYLCLPKQSTGFKIGENNKWVQADFSIEHIKHTLKLHDNGRWKWFTNDAIEYACTAFNQVGQMACDNIATEIRFNRDTLKYTLFYMTGYAIPERFIGTELEREELPYVQIGTCIPLTQKEQSI